MDPQPDRPGGFYCPVFGGFLSAKFPRPAVLAGASVFPQALSGYDLSLLTEHRGQQDGSGSPQLMNHEVTQVDCHAG